MRGTLASESQIKVEYIAIVDPVTLVPVSRVDGQTIVAIAARVNGTRLIDNITLAQGLG
jgi:pantothenate synthetase